MKKTILVILAVLLIIFAVGCSTEEPEFGLGTIEDGKYINDFFGYSIDVPKDYHLLTQEEIIEMNTLDNLEEQVEKEPIATPDPDKLDEEGTVYYLYALKYPKNSKRDVNPYMAVYSENLRYAQGINSKEDYVRYNGEFARQMFNENIDITVSDLEKVWFGERQFAKGSVTIDLKTAKLIQDIYVIVKNDYALVTILGYSNDEEKAELEEYINTIKMEK